MNFDLSVEAFEPFTETIDSRNNDYLFEEKGEENTIVFYFCFATHGETDQEKEKNMKIYLLFKNYSKEALRYLSDIQTVEEGEYESTSNIGMYPGVKGTEIWPHMIYFIGLHDFQKYNTSNIIKSEEE